MDLTEYHLARRGFLQKTWYLTLLALAACQRRASRAPLPQSLPTATFNTEGVAFAAAINTAIPSATFLPSTPIPLETATPPPLSLSTLIAPPSTEIDEETMPQEPQTFSYEPLTIRTVSGQEVAFYILGSNELIVPPIVPIHELALPIPDRYHPFSQQGFHRAHRAWDISYSQNPDGGPVEVVPPHPNALLIAAFPNIPLGPLAQHLNASGGIEVFYLTVEQNSVQTPYLILYAHLSNSSVQHAVQEAQERGGHLQSAGFVGTEGLTDGKHVHLITIDANALLRVAQMDNILAALWMLASSTDPVDQQIFVNPSEVFLTIQHLPRS